MFFFVQVRELELLLSVITVHEKPFSVLFSQTIIFTISGQLLLMNLKEAQSTDALKDPQALFQN